MRSDAHRVYFECTGPKGRLCQPGVMGAQRPEPRVSRPDQVSALKGTFNEAAIAYSGEGKSFLVGTVSPVRS